MAKMKNRDSFVAGVIILIILIAGGGIAYQQGVFTSNDSPNQLIKDSGDGISDYSAVFLANGQVYFGKMYKDSNKDVDLRDIYYLQVNQDLQKADGDTKDVTDATKTTDADKNKQPDVVLVKLGEELHGPNDRMTINKDQVLFTESLKTSSKVIDAINNYKK